MTGNEKRKMAHDRTKLKGKRKNIAQGHKTKKRKVGLLALKRSLKRRGKNEG